MDDSAQIFIIQYSQGAKQAKILKKTGTGTIKM